MHRALSCGAILLVGCTEPDPALFSLPTTFAEDSPEAATVLDLGNDPEVSALRLDGAIGLDGRAAAALIDHRDGPDAEPGTADDDLFDTLRELEETPFVGQTAVYAMFEYGWLRGYNETLVRGFDGVGFTPAEARNALSLANTADDKTLDDELGLDRRAVDSILAARPIDGMAELAELHYVGESALRTLRDAEVGEPDGWL